MLAGIGGRNGLRGVQVVGRVDTHHVQRRVGQGVFETVVDSRVEIVLELLSNLVDRPRSGGDPVDEPNALEHVHQEL